MNSKHKFKLVPLAACIGAITLAGCGGSDDPPPAQTYTISAIGGVGGADGGAGGSGNDVYMEKYGRGDLAVLSTGTASTSPAGALIDTSTTAPSTSLGDVPLHVTADLTINVEAAEPAAGTYYMVANNSNIYLSDGDTTLGNVDTDEKIVTGVHVASGATLTLALNAIGATYAQISLQNDFYNQGTVTTADVSATNRGSLWIMPASFVNAGNIALAGTQAGQHGGNMRLWADYSAYNNGPIDTSGAAGTAGAGGNAGSIDLGAESYAKNTAALTANGGNSTSAAGGNGQDIYVGASIGDAINTANLTSLGGNGTVGGYGASIDIWSDGVGDVINTGDLTSNGGSGSGGDGGYSSGIELYGYSGHLVNTGDLSARGGDTTDATANGGNGGYIGLEMWESGYYEYTPLGNMEISGNINTSGGNAVATGSGDGGNAGRVYAMLEVDDYTLGQHLKFLGYTAVDVSGGDGNYGGSAGDFGLGNWYTYNSADVYESSGNVINQADLTGDGGNVVATATTTPANGGEGGSFNLETDYWVEGMFPDLAKVTNSGDVSLSGGNDLNSTTQWSGTGGYVWFWGYNGVTNSGNISANGGSDLGTTGCSSTVCIGNYGGDIEFYTETGKVANSGHISANGGDGQGGGGSTDGIDFEGAVVSSSGNLSANGGNASASISGSVGGNGGWIYFYSPNGTAGSSSSGTASYSGGTGETAGDEGALVVGGMCKGSCS